MAVTCSEPHPPFPMDCNWRAQATFAGTSDCESFVPNRLRPSICCECMKALFAHRSEAVKDDRHIKSALEHSQEGEKVPTRIPLNRKGFGSLFMGGFRAVLNVKFLADEGVTGVVNCAKGLEMFGPKYMEGKIAAANTGIIFHELKWVDAMDQDITPESLRGAVCFLHSIVSGGGSAIVHCAQGKSRSAVVTASYLAVLNQSTIDDAIAAVHVHRSMAEPNASFIRQLRELEKGGFFASLHTDLVGTAK